MRHRLRFLSHFDRRSQPTRHTGHAVGDGVSGAGEASMGSNTVPASRQCAPVRQSGRLRLRCCKFAIPGRILEWQRRRPISLRVRWDTVGGHETAMVAVYSWIGMAASIRPNLPPSAPSALAVTFVRVGLTSMAAEALAIGRRGPAGQPARPPAYRHLCRVPGRFSGSPCQLWKPLGIRTALALAARPSSPLRKRTRSRSSSHCAISLDRLPDRTLVRLLLALSPSSAIDSCRLPRPQHFCTQHTEYTHTHFALLGLAHPQRAFLPHHQSDHSTAPATSICSGSGYSIYTHRKQHYAVHLRICS